jgi:uncharacterized repeat protein (TIGR03806 family)
MKKFALYSSLLFLVLSSCQNDDDNFIALCETPSNLVANDVNHNSTLLSWDYLDNNATFIVEYGLNGFQNGTGTTTNISDNQLQLIDLTANTNYQVFIKAICDTNNESDWSQAISFTTLPEPVVAAFRPNLSELNLFQGTLSDLNPSVYAFEYQLKTQLFTDYAFKQRLIALPTGESMTYDGEGLPIFPENTLIAKTFYYYNDERNPSAGKHIIETRILLKINGEWQTGDYKWNDDATEASLDPNGSEVPVSWVDQQGNENNITYKIPSNTDCFTCHNRYDIATPIGPKIRTLNFEVNGENQIQHFIDSGYLTGLNSPDGLASIVNWEDTNASLEDRARSYFDVNCAHCHIPGGMCDVESNLNLDFATSFNDSKIFENRFNIRARMGFYIPGFSMPYIGTVSIHSEGVALIFEYLDTL